MKNQKIFLKLILFTAVLGLGVFQKAYAAFPGELKMIDKTRISHPAYTMAIMWKTGLGSWNLKCDAGNINCSFRGDKILLWENNLQDTEHYPYAEPGRYWIWGSVSTLKTLSKAYDSCVSGGGAEANCSRTWYDAYRANTHTVPAYNANKYNIRIMWSAIPGEEDIIYALRKDAIAGSSSYMVVKYNTATETETDVVSYNPGNGIDLSNAGIVGWTSDLTPILIVANNIKRTWDTAYKIWEVDVTANPPTRTVMNSFPAYCQTKGCLGGVNAGNSCDSNSNCPGSSCVDTDRWARYPEEVAIHGGKSPDGNWGLVYSANAVSGVLYRDGHNLLGIGCNTSYNGGGVATFQEGDWNSGKITHPSWTVSNDWYFGGDEGDAFGTYTGSPSRINWWAYPWIDTNKHIYQVFWDAATQRIIGHVPVVTDTGAGLHGIDNRQVCLDGANKGRSCSVANICPGPDCQCPNSECRQISAQLNYNGLADPTPRADGRQLLWMNNGNHFSAEDHYCCDHPFNLTGDESIRRCNDVDYRRGLNCSAINADWMTSGYMIADLAPVGDSDTTPPTAPTGVSVR